MSLNSIEVTLSSHPQEEDTEGDVGLQLKVNFTDKAVQRNARLAGKWGPAENTLSFFPFAPGESFKVRVLPDIGVLVAFIFSLSELCLKLIQYNSCFENFCISIATHLSIIYSLPVLSNKDSSNMHENSSRANAKSLQVPLRLLNALLSVGWLQCVWSGGYCMLLWITLQYEVSLNIHHRQMCLLRASNSRNVPPKKVPGKEDS